MAMKATVSTDSDLRIKFNKVRVRLVTTSEMLGMSPSDPKLYSSFMEFKKKKAIEELSKKVKKGITEEEKQKLLQSDIEEVNKIFSDPLEAEAVKLAFEEIQKEYQDSEGKITCFQRLIDNPSIPVLGDWQLKGALKEFWKGLIKEAPSAKVAAYVDLIESDVHFFPVDYPLPKSGRLSWSELNEVNKANAGKNRKQIPIQMPEGFTLGGNDIESKLCQRPLRAMTAQGPRVTIACSEMIPAGAVVEFIITYTNKDDHLDKIHDAFCFGGMNRGLCEWRTGGKGRFYVDAWEYID